MPTTEGLGKMYFARRLLLFDPPPANPPAPKGSLVAALYIKSSVSVFLLSMAALNSHFFLA